jgi:nitrite reductase (NAD(P)H)
MVVEQVRQLGLDVLLSKRVGQVNTDDSNNVIGVTFEDGETMDCSTICFAIGIRARDDLARNSGIKCADRGGGIIINPDLSTSATDVYAIGECASWESQTFGLIAPGIEMADVLAFNLTQAKAHTPRKFKRPDLSTKLKLLGVDVASFGDFFADRDGPKDAPKRRRGAKSEPHPDDSTPTVKALTYRDPFQQIYKKYLFTPDGKYIIGGMMIGETKDYVKLVSMVNNQKPLEVPPSQFIIGKDSGDDDADDLDDNTQICSCHNVTKGKLRAMGCDHMTPADCQYRRCLQRSQRRHMQIHWRRQVMHQGRHGMRRLHAARPDHLQQDHGLDGSGGQKSSMSAL